MLLIAQLLILKGSDFRHAMQVWPLLVWQGKQTHSPVVVAAKPYLFVELDVCATVCNLRNRSPGFWESEELISSLESGDFLAMDAAFFVKVC